MIHTDPYNGTEYTVGPLAVMLYKLRVAGLKKVSVSHQAQMVRASALHPRLPIGKLVIRLAIVSMSVDYLILVPYAERDAEYDQYCV